MPKLRRIIPGKARGRFVTFTFDGNPVQAYEGETLAAALMADGYWVMGRAGRQRRERGYFCGMGVCSECLVTVAGEGHVRACRRLVAESLVVKGVNEIGHDE